jgi:hypothetical protein
MCTLMALLTGGARKSLSETDQRKNSGSSDKKSHFGKFDDSL